MSVEAILCHCISGVVMPNAGFKEQIPYANATKAKKQVFL
jgi:hypothetical protein